MDALQPGDWIHKTKLLADHDFADLNWQISTDRYTSREFQKREHERVWSKVWQIVGRSNELPGKGDWKVYTC